MTRIDEIRKKFIMISMVSFVFVMLFTGILVNFAYEIALRAQMGNILDKIIENDGILPQKTDSEMDTAELQEAFHYGIRYFSVIFDSNGSVNTVNIDRVTAANEEQAVEYARGILRGSSRFGNSGEYYFKKRKLSDNEMIVAAVNSATQIQIRKQVVYYTVLICAAGMVITSIVVFLLSKKVISTEVENVKRQKEFITNASHELKTPLAVIRANTEILEMTGEENEWTRSTLRQVDHMNSLIQNLVMISRASELEDLSTLTRINASAAVKETAEPFRAVALNDKKEFETNISENIYMLCNGSKIRQLVSILTDNAIKYCDPEGKIIVSFQKAKHSKTAVLTVSNSYKAGEGVDYRRFFERFYREDKSHENQKGYGIGLSMAESICTQNRGKIQAEWKNGIISFVCILSPVVPS